MFCLRLVKSSDKEKILKLASHASFGMTNIPKSLADIERKIDQSLKATKEFIKRDNNSRSNNIKSSDKELERDTGSQIREDMCLDAVQDFSSSATSAHDFLLVLEEDDGNITGLSAIYTNIGFNRPFYTYRISNLDSLSPELNLRIAHKILILVNDYHGYSELGSLLLDPAYRSGGRGKLLSYGRFMLVAQNQQLFGSDIMAEMLGHQDKNGNSPFWSAIGNKFIHLAFHDADLQTTKDNHFITDLMPKFPIYISLLPIDAQEVIGKTHKNTIPARAMLEKQGIVFKSNIDIFDAGPCLEGSIKDIPLIKKSNKLKLSQLPHYEERSALVSSVGFKDFKVTYNINNKNQLAKLLNLNEKDQITFSSLK